MKPRSATIARGAGSNRDLVSFYLAVYKLAALTLAAAGVEDVFCPGVAAQSLVDITHVSLLFCADLG